jgi:hypothetical protein
MRKWALLFLAVVLAVPMFAADQLTVAELESAVAKARHKSDAHVAKELSGLQLTERLSTARWMRMNADLPGAAARLALIALADRSVFLDLPASEIPATPGPDRAAQDGLLAKTAAYAKETLTMLPDFFATQLTTEFSDSLSKNSRPSGVDSDNRNLHLVAQFSATVRFLGGVEEIERGRTETRSVRSDEKPLAVQGVFGPLLRVILKDALANHPAWSHWEQGIGGPIAVFHYDVPEGKSHYFVGGSIDSGILEPIVAYHGDIGLNPDTGAIMRLSMIAAPHANGPVARGDLMVEYGPVEIAGKTYICPLRSVAISLARRADLMHDVYKFQQDVQPPFQFELNDVTYAQYHLFHAEMRVLPEEGDGIPTSPDNKPVRKQTTPTSPQR